MYRERLLIGGVQMEHEKKQFKNKTELAKALNIGSRKTLYERAKKNNVDLDKLEFDEEELSYLSGKRRKIKKVYSGTNGNKVNNNREQKEQERYTKETQKIAELEATLSGKIELIEQLQKDNDDLSKKLDAKEASLKSLLTQQQLLTLQNTVSAESKETTIDGDYSEAEEVKTDNVTETDKPKKHWWNIFS